MQVLLGFGLSTVRGVLLFDRRLLPHSSSLCARRSRVPCHDLLAKSSLGWYNTKARPVFIFKIIFSQFLS